MSKDTLFVYVTYTTFTPYSTLSYDKLIYCQ